MTITVTLPGGIVVRAGGQLDQPMAGQPDWGVYADSCWDGWPGIVLDWPDFGLPADDAASVQAIVQAFARARGGQDVLVGCSGGTGRTGTILACLAILAGVPVVLAVPWVRDRYRRRAVETQAQVGWVVDRFGQADLVRKEVASSRARLVKAAIDPIRQAMREALHQPERSPVLAWAVPGVLAVTQRPLRVHPLFGGSGHSYPAESRPAIDEWITRLANQGIRSVVVLTSNKELAHYDAPTAPDGGLLAQYRGRGLDVVHLPADDPAHDVTAREAFEAAVNGIAVGVAEALRHVPLPAVDVGGGTVRSDGLGRTTHEIANKHSRSSLLEGDVLLCIIRNLRVAIVPSGLDGANITQGMVRFRPGERVIGRYLAAYLESPYAQRWMKDQYVGLAMPRINVADARAIPVPLPPLDEQTEIVGRLDHLLGVAKTVEEQIESSNARLERTSQSILAKAFRGELMPIGR